MHTFGKRQYAHMEPDPWARKKTPREAGPATRPIPPSRIGFYLVALVAVGALAFAGLEMLILA